MDPVNASTCRWMLDQLRTQIGLHFPDPAGYGPPAVPIDRHPLLADVVRTYVETEAVLAQATATDPTDGCQQ